ncbi:MAG: preprotein translocase subunit TatC [Alphaproteobacteria bacterium HGW-Alphaproteobacteria-12]|nr:MAG: preprotein translocase subunit TatC [Alphaproteobacteria bacterium HGW-Alphaproteobacteria-12]
MLKEAATLDNPEKSDGRWCMEADAAGGATNEAEIERLVRTFYARIREDEVLGPIFDKAIGENWEPHLLKMCDFWSSVMLTTGRYKGQPMRAHLKLKTVTPGHFDRWLMLFRATAEEVCAPETAERFVEKAARIAESLQLGMFFKPQLHDPEGKRACC